MIIKKNSLMEIDGEVGNVFSKRNFDMIYNFELTISMVPLSFHFAFIQMALFFQRFIL